MPCATCEGTGTIRVTDWVPYGNGSVPMRSYEACPDCLSNGRCPQCNGELIEPDYVRCSVCDWEDTP
jgi:RecJ-like exonuclease